MRFGKGIRASWDCLEVSSTAPWPIEDLEGIVYNDGVLIVCQFYRILGYCSRWEEADL